MALLQTKKADINIDLPQLRGANIISVLLLLACAAAGGGVTYLRQDAWGVIVGAVLGIILAQSPRVAQQWERAIVLRLGRYAGPARAGALLDRPVHRPGLELDRPADDHHVSFAAEQTLTSDTVPVNVDAVLFWMVYDPEKAALEVQDYKRAVSWAAQTALRDIIGRTPLTVLLRGPRADRGRPAEADRRAVEPLGRDGPVGRDARRGHPRVAPGRDVARGPGGAREGGADHPRPGRGRDRPPLRPGLQVLRREPDGAAPPGHEHPLRGAQGEGRADARSPARPSSRWAWAACSAPRPCGSRPSATASPPRPRTARSSDVVTPWRRGFGRRGLLGRCPGAPRPRPGSGGARGSAAASRGSRPRPGRTTRRASSGRPCRWRVMARKNQSAASPPLFRPMDFSRASSASFQSPAR